MTKQADWILTHATVVTMDTGYRILPDGAVAVAGDSILAVGPTDAILAGYRSEDVLDCSGRTIIPGLVNAHTHISMTMLRGLEDDRRLDVWLLGYVMPVEREFVSPEFCRVGARIACAEMIRSGITCFADMYYFEDAVAEAVAEVGMRAVCSQTVLKFPAPDARSYEDSLAAAREFIAKWKGHALITPSVAPHAPYTCTAEILKACSELAVEFDVPLHIHIAETRQEVEQWRQEYDMPVVPWVKKQGLFDAKVLAAHCVHIDAGEIHTLRHAGAGVAHNPSSNMKLASGFAPVVQMMGAGLNVGIGTDGPSSNNDLDMFEEIRMASMIAKGNTGDPTALPAREVLAMATILGARALHLGDITGSLEPGKRADLVLVDLQTLHNLPHFDRDPNAVYASLVYTAKSSDVLDVMVNGRWLMRERKLQTLEVEPSLEEAARYARRIDAFLTEREGSVLSKLIAIGGAEQQESYEVQIKVHVDEPEGVFEALESGELDIVRTAHYQEYDTYFTFNSNDQDRLRYREDQFIDAQGQVSNVRYRLTLIGPVAEREFPNSVLLSRSRFIAPAGHSLRFYREYFKPDHEMTINKNRRRWLVRFRGVEFFVNVDQLVEPPLEGVYVEVKSRTWSRNDAEQKSALISDLIAVLGIKVGRTIHMDYPELISVHSR